MKKLKLTDVQKFKLQTSYDNANSVLREVKALKLEGDALKFMKELEETISHLELVVLTARQA